MGLNSVLLPVVVADTKIVSQLHSGGFAGQSEQTGNKINCISVRLASETMETVDFSVNVEKCNKKFPILIC